MKKLILLFIVLLPAFCTGQVASSCIVPAQLYQEYKRDIKILALNRMYQLQSADTSLVQIPEVWQDTISEGLSAIFNATSIPERDSVFNLYCVHDNNDQHAIYNGMLIRVDTSYSWTHAWQNLNAITGNAFIDNIMTNYDVSVSQFFNWSIGNYALLHTDSFWNIYALIDSFKMDPAVISGEPDAIIGSAGHISYNKIGNDRYYNFFFEFSDCFDGCDNYREWQFRVNSDCSVDYLGYVDWGVFGILPLPTPINCNVFVSVDDELQSFNLKIFPNPATNMITIKNGSESMETIDLALFDFTGRKVLEVYKISGIENKIDISQFTSGIYSYRISAKNSILASGKIIKE